MTSSDDEEMARQLLDSGHPSLSGITLAALKERGWMRLSYPELGHDSGDLYGKVLAEEQQHDVCVTCIRLTSVDAMDQKIIDSLIGT